MTYRVQLAVSPLGGLPGVAAAWHSSVLVDGEEFSFSDAGITVSRGTASHNGAANQTSVMEMGHSKHSGRKLFEKLERHFLPGTYDLLRKNCNSMSDAALFFMLGRRLDKQYRQLEQIGAGNVSLVQAASNGQYTPNPKAADFDLKRLIEELDPEKVWRTPGQATGGATRATSAEGLRMARLARFSGCSSGGDSSQAPSLGADRQASASSQQIPGPQVATGSLDLLRDAERLLGACRQSEPLHSLSSDEALAREVAEREMSAGPAHVEPEQARSQQASTSQLSDEEFARQLADEELARSLQDTHEAEYWNTRRNSSNAAGYGPQAVPPQFSQALGAGAAAINGASQVLGGLFQEMERAANTAVQELDRAANVAAANVSNASSNVRAHVEPSVPSEGSAAARTSGHQDPFNRPFPAAQLLNEARRLAQSVRVPEALGEFLDEIDEAFRPTGGQAGPRPNRGAGMDTVFARTVEITADDAAEPGVSTGSAAQTDSQCMICFEGFVPGQQLRLLPCCHKYHKECIDPWLRQSSLCPLCKNDIRS